MPPQDWFAQFESKAPAADDWFAQFGPAPQAERESKSASGFLRNIVTSGKNTARGMLSTLNPRNWDDMARSVKKQTDDFNAQPLDRHGVGIDPARLRSQVQQVADTAYNDPVGTAFAFTPTGSRAPLQRIKGSLQRTGVGMMRSAVKPDTANLSKMAGATYSGLDKVADEVAQTALTEGVNPMTRGGLDTIQRRVENLGTVRDADIAAAPQVPIAGSGRRHLTALAPVVKKYRGSQQSTPQADLREIQTFARDMKANPDITTRGPGRTRPMRDQTPAELNQLNKGDNKALAGKFNKVGDAEIDARRAVIGARRDLMDEAVPGTKDIGQKMRRLIDLRNVSNVARKRGEGRDTIGINDMIALGSGRPEALVLSTAMRPAVQAGIASRLHRTGAALPSEIDMTALQRLALLQLMTSQPERP